MRFEAYAPDFSYILRRDILHWTGAETETKTKNIHHQTEKEGNKGK